MIRARRSVFYGWWIVLTAAVGLFWGPPISVYAFAVFLKPLMRDFHATRAAVSLSFSLHSVAGAISAPLVGRFIDRCGTRRVIVAAAATLGLTLISIRALSASLGQFYFSYAVVGICSVTLVIAYSKVVSRWFDRQRGLALGLMMLGIGSGAMVMPALAQALISSFGWRAAYAILGLAVLLIPLPAAAAFLRENPQRLGLAPDGARPVNARSGGHADAPGLSASEAWQSRTFWLMVCAFFLVGASVQGCLVHTAAMLADRGLTAQRAALGSSLAGAAVLIGRVGTGYLLDRLFAPRLAALFFGGVAVGIGLLGTGTSTGVVCMGAFLVGLGLGAEVDIIAYLSSRYFGLRSFASIYSSAFGPFVLAGALGPLLMGAGYDLTGSYHAPLAALFILTLIAAALMARLGPYRYGATLARGRAGGAGSDRSELFTSRAPNITSAGLE